MSVKNKKIVENIIMGLSKSNGELYLNYLADDIKWNIIGMPLIKGKSNFLKAVKILEFENFPYGKIKNVIAEGEYVVVESRGGYKIDSEILNSPAHCDIYRLKNGLIHEITTYAVDTTKE